MFVSQHVSHCIVLPPLCRLSFCVVPLGRCLPCRVSTRSADFCHYCASLDLTSLHPHVMGPLASILAVRVVLVAVIDLLGRGWVIVS